jgi:hypothetical protein
MKIRSVGPDLFNTDGRTARHDDVNNRFFEILRKRLQKSPIISKQWVYRLAFQPEEFCSPSARISNRQF